MRTRAEYENILDSVPIVKPFLALIRWAEGATYNTLFGGGTFTGYNWHPLQPRAIPHRGRTTSAAGAYQFQRGTWDNVARRLGLTSFEPRNQDIAAVALIDSRGALDDLLNGQIGAAIEKLKPEWESFAVRPSSALMTRFRQLWSGEVSSEPGPAPTIAAGTNLLGFGRITDFLFQKVPTARERFEPYLGRRTFTNEQRFMIAFVIVLIVVIFAWREL